MAQLRLELETGDGQQEWPARLSDVFRQQLGLRIEVTAVALGTLPRFEAKAKRWIREN